MERYGSVWKRVVKPGDTVVDATCGNGHDTLVLTNMVCIPEVLGSVYALDVQEDGLANTSYLLDHKLDELQVSIYDLPGLVDQ